MRRQTPAQAASAKGHPTMTSSNETKMLVSQVYLVRWRAYGGDMSGQSADANRVFLSLEDAKAFAKLSAQAYAARYYGHYVNPFENLEPREDGKYHIHTEVNGLSFSPREFKLPEPVAVTDGDKVFSIVRDDNIQEILFGLDRSEAIHQARTLAKELANNNSPCHLNAHIDDFQCDLVEIIGDADCKHHRGTYSFQLQTKKNPDVSLYEDEDLEGWFSQSLTRLEVVYTDIGKFEPRDGLDQAALNSAIAGNWLHFMGGTFHLGSLFS
jgi:hypothetical protein